MLSLVHAPGITACRPLDTPQQETNEIWYVKYVNVSYSEFPTLDSFERILNYIPFVNIFLMFPLTLSFEL